MVSIISSILKSELFCCIDISTTSLDEFVVPFFGGSVQAINIKMKQIVYNLICLSYLMNIFISLSHCIGSNWLFYNEQVAQIG